MADILKNDFPWQLLCLHFTSLHPSLLHLKHVLYLSACVSFFFLSFLRQSVAISDADFPRLLFIPLVFVSVNLRRVSYVQ